VTKATTKETVNGMSKPYIDSSYKSKLLKKSLSDSRLESSECAQVRPLNCGRVSHGHDVIATARGKTTRANVTGAGAIYAMGEVTTAVIRNPPNVMESGLRSNCACKSLGVAGANFLAESKFSVNFRSGSSFPDHKVKEIQE
jgi:hypothetical protein